MPSPDKIIKARYYLSTECNKPGIMIAVSISSKAGGAVWRNRVKRLIKESVRAEKEHLNELVLFRKASLLVIFSQNKITQQSHKYMFLKNIKPPVQDILNHLKQIINDLKL